MLHDGRRYRRVSLDTAADEDTSDDMQSLGRLMRERPTMQSERGLIRRTSNGNLIVARA